MHYEEKTLTNEGENDHESMVIKEPRLFGAGERTSLEASQFPREDPWARRLRGRLSNRW